MPSRFQVEQSLAAEAAGRGDALEAAVRSCLAARAAPGDLDRVGALADARRHLDTAFHQAVWAANRAGRSWRAMAERTGWSFQSLYRRYHARPARTPRRATPPMTGELDDLMGSP